MNIVIVAKTRMRAGVCIGGLNEESGDLIRLLPQAGAHGWPRSTAIEIGEIWRVRAAPVQCFPPHVEDRVVKLESRLGTIESLREFITRRHNPWACGPKGLFNGLIRFTERGRGFISMNCGVPNNSVGFWMLPVPLRLVKIHDKTYYTAMEGARQIAIKYVGLSEPEVELPAGRMVRLSLARWWAPADTPCMESRCYLQLSGWYSDDLCEPSSSSLATTPAKDNFAESSTGDSEYDIDDDDSDESDEDFDPDDWLDWDESDLADEYDATFGGMMVPGSDDPPGGVFGSDYGEESSLDALFPWGRFTHREEDEDD